MHRVPLKGICGGYIGVTYYIDTRFRDIIPIMENQLEKQMDV